MPAPSDSVKAILIRARILEDATAGAGVTYIQTGVSTFAGINASGGLQMVSASTAGKSFSFVGGLSTMAAGSAFVEAFGIWQSYTSDQIAALVDKPPTRQTLGRF